MFGAFTSFGKLGSLARAIAAAWTPSALWPTGTEPGMWISPSTLPASFNDYTGTTPVAVPGTVADSANPVGLALDIRAGAPTTLGPELVVNGDFAAGSTGWNLETGWSISGGQASISNAGNIYVIYQGGLTPGKTYFISFTITSISAGGFAPYCGDNLRDANFNTVGTHTAIFVCGANGYLGVRASSVGTTGSITNISFKEIPGNHMLQATSAARPLESARVNLLQYTEDFVAFDWRNFNSGMTITTGQADPDGGATAVLLKPTAALNWHGFDKPGYFSNIGDNTFRVYIKPDGLQYFFAITGLAQASDIGTLGACFDLTGAGSVVRVGAWNASATIELDASGYYICTLNSTKTSGGISFGASNSTTWGEFTGDGTSGFYFAFPDLRRTGSAATPPLYQSVPGNGSSYNATGITPFQLYDGTDDGMATASFSAGTLSSAMDCMIAVRRDSGAACMSGLIVSTGGTKYFGLTVPSIAYDTFSNCGTPTCFVDGVALTGAAKSDVLATALTVGDWHVLEYRGLDLSTWDSARFGDYSGFLFPGPRGDILLFPSTASTEDKDAARQYLADKYGVTLA